MAKKLVDVDGNEVVQVAPRVTDIKPTSSRILVEMLTPQEVLGTNFSIGADADVGAPQGRVVAIGSTLKTEELKVGDRVLLQGKYIPCPQLPNSNRELGLVEFHDVKAVLVE